MRANFSSSTILVAALVLTDAASGQCTNPQGNATLAISGLQQVGSQIRLTVTGAPYAPFVLAVDTSLQTSSIAGATICLGPTLKLLLNGLSSGFVAIPPTGSVDVTLTIPPDGGLTGASFYFQAFVLDSAAPSGWLAVSNASALNLAPASASQEIFFEDFEAGWGSWFATNGVWQVGTPTSGPGAAYSGTRCGATVLDGNYPTSANTRLVSPTITLPTSSSGETIELLYRCWFATEKNYDAFTPEVSTDGGLNWVGIPLAAAASGSNPIWAQLGADLTAFQGQSIRLAFRFWSDSVINGAGVYIDDVRVLKSTFVFNNPEGFEAGLGDGWFSSQGVWETGVATVGPSSACSGSATAGTLLHGNYPNSMSSNLYSPPVVLPSQGAPNLYFCSWFQLENGYDVGRVFITTNNGVSWIQLSSNFTGSSGGWTQYAASLAPYLGQTVRFAFQVASDSVVNAAGWYLDDIRIQ